MVDVVDILVELVLPCDGVSTMHLGIAGETRPYLMSPCLVFTVKRKVSHQKRPRPHYGHVPFQDVHKLGKLIQGCGSEDLAEMREPHIIRKKVPVFVPGITHASELVEGEDPSIETGTLLLEDHWGAKLRSHQYCKHKEHGGQDDQRDKREYEVLRPFDESFVEALSVCHEIYLLKQAQITSMILFC